MAHSLHESAGWQNGYGRMAGVAVADVESRQPGTLFPQGGYEDR